jgi:hypothetical protein
MNLICYQYQELEILTSRLKMEGFQTMFPNHPSKPPLEIGNFN